MLAGRGDLDNWTKHGPESITNGILYRYSELVNFELSGRIMSTEGNPLIAFDRRSPMMSGTYVVAASSEFFILFDYSNRILQVRYNEEILGRIDSLGNVFTATGQCIALAQRPGAGKMFIIDSNHSMGELSYPLNMYGRDLAEICVPLDRGRQGIIGTSMGSGSPVIRLLETPTAEEEKWLIAIAIWEVVYHGFSPPSHFRHHHRPHF